MCFKTVLWTIRTGTNFFVILAGTLPRRVPWRIQHQTWASSLLPSPRQDCIWTDSLPSDAWGWIKSGRFVFKTFSVELHLCMGCVLSLSCFQGATRDADFSNWQGKVSLPQHLVNSSHHLSDCAISGAWGGNGLGHWRCGQSCKPKLRAQSFGALLLARLSPCVFDMRGKNRVYFHRFILESKTFEIPRKEMEQGRSDHGTLEKTYAHASPASLSFLQQTASQVNVESHGAWFPRFQLQILFGEAPFSCVLCVCVCASNFISWSWCSKDGNFQSTFKQFLWGRSRSILPGCVASPDEEQVSPHSGCSWRCQNFLPHPGWLVRPHNVAGAMYEVGALYVAGAMWPPHPPFWHQQHNVADCCCWQQLSQTAMLSCKKMHF